MDTFIFSSSELLHILFKYVNQPPSVMAQRYIDRDRTLVYKWMKGIGATPAKLVPGIVKFVMENSCESERHFMRGEILICINRSPLDSRLKASIIAKEDFRSFLEEVFYIANIKKESVELEQTEQPDLNKTQGMEIVTAIPVISLLFALMASASGGFLWNLFNHLFGLTYYSGSSGNEPQGILSLIWGITVLFPIMLFAILSLIKTAFQVSLYPTFFKCLIIALYAISGGIGAFFLQFRSTCIG